MGLQIHLVKSIKASLPVRQAGTTLSLTVTLSEVEVFHCLYAAVNILRFSKI
jgi:hypothetical protein